MRCCFVGCLVCGLVTGCGPGAQPEVSRTVAESADEIGAAAAEDTVPESGDVSDDETVLNLELVALDVPEGWVRKTASSSFLLAEYSLPVEAGDAATGRLTVSVAGGSVEANIDRWRSQFGGNLEQDAKTEFEANGLPVTMVDLVGEFNDQRGPFAPATKHAGYRMLAAIVSVDGQLHFIKATGPKETIAKHEDAIQAFVKSIKPS